MLHIVVILIGRGFLWLLHRLDIKNSTRLLVVAGLLIIFGLFALYSISVYESFTMTLGKIQAGKMEGEPSNYYYFYQQIKNLLIALVAWWITYFIPIKRIKNNYIILAIFAGVIALQISVFTSLGVHYNGADWWINLPLIGNLQPAEFFKLWFVIFFSRRLIRKAHFFKEKSLYLAMTIILWMIWWLFMTIPDLGSMLVIALVACMMAIYSWAKIKYLLGMAGIGLCVAFLAVFTIPKLSYIQTRLGTYISEGSEEARDAWYRQTRNAIVAVWWGWVFWQWYGKGLQKFGRIPEAQSDFIFAALSEEIGLVGNLFIISLYMLLGRYGILAIEEMRDQYSKVLSIGIISLILIQAFVNISVNIGILPNTGITLPFISHGGTALLINILEIALLYKLIENR